MAEQEQNRSEAATPFKLEEARRKGSVPKSLDINAFVILFAGAACLHFWGGKIASEEMRLFSQVLSNSHQVSFEIDSIGSLLTALLKESLALLAPVFAVVAILAVLATFFQTGPVFSFHPLKPDFDRVNPMAGFKRVFSLRLVIEAIKSILKIIVLGSVLYFAMQAAMPTLLRSLNAPATALGHILLPLADVLLAKLLAALALVTAIDAVYSRWDFARRMRMSRREIREEVKRREGDPRVKSRLRELQREAVKRARSLGRVKDADVLVTNPVHLAVAIKYERERIDAPLVVAKGAGFLAARMRDMARRHRVPIVENRPLARALFHQVEIDQAVPAEHYGVMARILVWVYSLRQAAGTGRRA